MAEAYHYNVYAAFAMQTLCALAMSVGLGPLFDVYLFKLGGDGGGNTLVGAVESVSGLVALGLVLPVGYIVDRFDRLMLMRLAAVIGLLSSAAGAWAVATDSIPVWYLTMVLSGIYGEIGGSTCYALFADSVTSESRTVATTRMAMISSVASAAGPGLSLVAFYFIGDNWQLAQLRMILMFGMVVLNPLACISMFCFKKAPYESAGGDDEAEGGGDEGEGPDSGKYQKRRGARFVPALIAFSDLITMIGAGMTIKYFNLYWKNDWNMSPTSVLAISVVQPLSIALFIKLLEKPASLIGRAQASLFCFGGSILAMIVLAEVNVLPVALFAYFIRSGLANASYPFNKSIMFDFTPSSQRGRWNAVETLCGSVWSGSAFIGGYMADKYDYRFTFLVTAGVYGVACLIYLPLLWIVPRKSLGAQPDAEVSLLSQTLVTPGRHQVTPGRRIEPMLSPKMHCSPGHQMRLRSGSEI